MDDKADVWQGTLALMLPKFYRLTRAGRKQLEREAREWEQTTAIVARFLGTEEEPS